MARPGSPRSLTVALWALISLLAWATHAGGYGPAFAVLTLLLILALGIGGGLPRREAGPRRPCARIGERDPRTSLLRPEPADVASGAGARDTTAA